MHWAEEFSSENLYLLVLKHRLLWHPKSGTRSQHNICHSRTAIFLKAWFLPKQQYLLRLKFLWRPQHQPWILGHCILHILHWVPCEEHGCPVCWLEIQVSEWTHPEERAAVFFVFLCQCISTSIHRAGAPAGLSEQLRFPYAVWCRPYRQSK